MRTKSVSGVNLLPAYRGQLLEVVDKALPSSSLCAGTKRLSGLEYLRRRFKDVRRDVVDANELTAFRESDDEKTVVNPSDDLLMLRPPGCSEDSIGQVLPIESDCLHLGQVAAEFADQIGALEVPLQLR
jgi:hypothetical protein